MKCRECARELRKHEGGLSLLDSRFGPIHLREAKYWACPQCGSRLYAADTARSIAELRDIARTRLIRQRPIGEFVTAEEASSEFGVSRQAIHKNPKVYSTRFGRKPVYLRQSLVAHYCRGLDGRFSLWPYNPLDRIASIDHRPTDAYSCPTAGSVPVGEAAPAFSTASSRLEVAYGS